MVKTNHDIIGEQCIRNDDGVEAVKDKDSLEKLSWEALEQSLYEIGILCTLLNFLVKNFLKIQVSNAMFPKLKWLRPWF